MAQLDFHTFFRRVTETTSIGSQQDLATALGVNRSAITQAKRRNAVPQKWILALSREFGLNPDWLEFGKGARRRAQADGAAPAPLSPAGSEQSSMVELPAIATVPKVYARLCAGGGSFDVEAAVVEEHIFRQEWLARKGRPGSMVLMDVFGNSMEPEIREGDMVLVDQSQKDLFPGSIYAVGFEETVMVKRLERKAGEVVLHSDNPDYSPIQLRGDELDNFRIIGRIVWVSREYR